MVHPHPFQGIPSLDQGIDFCHTAVGVAGAALPPVKAGDGIVVVGRGPYEDSHRFNRYNMLYLAFLMISFILDYIMLYYIIYYILYII